jgi:phosphoribosylformylglycinamidine synthase PurS subunit
MARGSEVIDPHAATATTWLAKIVVVLKPVVNDPQGNAIRGGLHDLGYQQVTAVRAGKYFEVRLDAPNRAEAERIADEICRRLLANPVIEDYRFEMQQIA